MNPSPPTNKGVTKITTGDPAYMLAQYPPYTMTPSAQESYNRILKDITWARNVINMQYNYFNGLTLYQCIDDWTTRWNGYVVPLSVLDETDSNIFLNFTRNLIISYMAKVAAQPPSCKIKAVNKNTGLANQKFADVLKDLNQYSLDEENVKAKFLAVVQETTVKGTCLVYEGYAKYTQNMKVPQTYDMEHGKFTWNNEERVIFDNCYQEIAKLEDVYISNAFEPDIQKQPFVIWKKITSYQEAAFEFGHYANWKYVVPGAYRVIMEPRTFYNTELYTPLQAYQTEIFRYYNKKENLLIIMCNGVILYSGPLPFKHGRYPFAKYIYEKFGNDFFWGAGAPFKFMGEQDTQNTFINMMIDKTLGSLLPYGLSSDLDDLIEDDQLAPNKIRKVGDINKWKFATLPGVSAGEQAMFQNMMDLLRKNSGLADAGTASTPTGGRLSVRQVLLQNQQNQQQQSYSVNFLEDGERDRTILRLYNIMQFYSIPKIQRITGKNGKEIEQLVYRDIYIHETRLSDGRNGTKIIKITDIGNEDDRMHMENDLALMEAMGDESGTPTEALALPISMFTNFNIQVQIVTNSSYTQNQVLDQAERQQYAQWRLAMAQFAPVDTQELIKWVDESYDIDTDRFTPKGTQPMNAGPGNVNPQNQPVAAGGGGQQPSGGPAENAGKMESPNIGDMMF